MRSERIVTKVIDIATTGGVITVQASVLGELAIHLAFNCTSVSPRWTITHIPTGFAVLSTENERQAYRVRKALLRVADWSSLKDPFSMPPELLRATKTVLQRYGVHPKALKPTEREDFKRIWPEMWKNRDNTDKADTV